MDELLKLINTYPSPHNGQPIEIKPIDSNNFELYFTRERGLQSADVSLIFSFVTMGVVVQHIEYCARALGHKFTYELRLPKVVDLKGSGNILFAKCSVNWNSDTPDDSLKNDILFRQTSRKKYHSPASQNFKSEINTYATESKVNLQALDAKQSSQAIWLNQRAVFDDMFDEAVRLELNHWLRYSKQEKESKKDGLSYDCMEINGSLMKLVVEHPGILRIPGISWMAQQYYLRTMKDNSEVFYVTAPFKTPLDSFNVGLLADKIWMAAAKDQSYIHPFGTIMSNHAAHADFVKLAGIQNESREDNYLVFIFRAGKSEIPVRSLRIPISEHLMKEV